MNFVLSTLLAMIASMAMAIITSPLTTRGAAPTPIGEGLTWCTIQAPGMCTLGIHNNFDTGEIDAYVFGYDCKLYNSTNNILTDSIYIFSWPGPSGSKQTGFIYIHDVTGGDDEFWYDSVHYRGGWSVENPSPVYYEFVSFYCG